MLLVQLNVWLHVPPLRTVVLASITHKPCQNQWLTDKWLANCAHLMRARANYVPPCHTYIHMHVTKHTSTKSIYNRYKRKCSCIWDGSPCKQCIKYENANLRTRTRLNYEYSYILWYAGFQSVGRVNTVATAFKKCQWPLKSSNLHTNFPEMQLVWDNLRYADGLRVSFSRVKKRRQRLGNSLN
jgi:hypothetical protein